MLASAGVAHIAPADPVAALPLADRLDDFDYGYFLVTVEHARSPLVPLSLELADRLAIRDAFKIGRRSAIQDQHASGLRAIAALEPEMARRRWDHETAGGHTGTS